MLSGYVHVPLCSIDGNRITPVCENVVQKLQLDIDLVNILLCYEPRGIKVIIISIQLNL